MADRFSEKLTFEQFMAIRTTLLKSLKMSSDEWLKLFIGGFVDSTGKPVVFPTTGGVFPVTEASASGISSYTLGIYNAQANGNANPTIATAAAMTPNDANMRRRIGRATGTCAGGAFANLSLVPALAGYYGVVKIVGVISNGAAAGATLTFESPAGTAALPSVFANTYAANTINRDLVDVVITHATLVDNQAIVVDGAGFGALDVVTIIYEYWYET